MLARHQNELLSRLERIADIGCAEVRKNELLLWFEQERMSVNVWRAILDKWEEIEGETPLLVGDSDGVWVFVYGFGLKTSESSWLQDVRTYAKRKLDGPAEDSEVPDEVEAVA